MGYEYRQGRVVDDGKGGFRTVEEAGTYDTATGAWLSPFNLRTLTGN